MSYAPARPKMELLEILASIAAYQDSKWNGRGPRWGRAGAWCIVRQNVISEWWTRVMKRHGYPIVTMCRRTLNYHLASLRRDRYLTVEQRHTRHRGRDHRYGELDLRPSLYKFTTLGRLWIKRRIQQGPNPLALVAVQKVAQSGFHDGVNFETSLSRAVDKSIHSPGRKPRGLSRSTSSSIHGELRRQTKAPVRKGRRAAQAAPGRTRRRSTPPRDQRRR